MKGAGVALIGNEDVDPLDSIGRARIYLPSDPPSIGEISGTIPEQDFELATCD
jgi:hypothetical protein